MRGELRSPDVRRVPQEAADQPGEEHRGKCLEHTASNQELARHAEANHQSSPSEHRQPNANYHQP